MDRTILPSIITGMAVMADAAFLVWVASYQAGGHSGDQLIKAGLASITSIIAVILATGAIICLVAIKNARYVWINSLFCIAVLLSPIIVYGCF